MPNNLGGLQRRSRTCENHSASLQVIAITEELRNALNTLRFDQQRSIAT